MCPMSGEPDSRSTPRLPAPATLWLRCRRGAPGAGPDLANGLLDVSVGGAQLLAIAPLVAGEAVEIVLGALDAPGAIRRAGEVRWAVELGDGACGVGVQFREPLTAAEVNSLTALPAAEPHSPDLLSEPSTATAEAPLDTDAAAI